jgi:hypothetical protein
MTTDTITADATPTTTTTTRPLWKTIARHLPTAGRVLLGLVFFVFGLNGFLSFIPAPKEMPPEGAMALGMAFMKSGYLFELIKGTEVLVGALLLCNRLVPLALVLLAPVALNILAFHLFLAPEGTGLAFVIVGLNMYLAWSYRAAYRPLVAFRATPQQQQ